MPLQKLPTVDLDNVNHRRGARERINAILSHQHDDSRIQTLEEKVIDLTPVNFGYQPGRLKRWCQGDGISDDTDALQAAFDTGLPIDDYGDAVYRTTQKIIIPATGLLQVRGKVRIRPDLDGALSLTAFDTAVTQTAGQSQSVFLTASARQGARTIVVNSVSGMSVGDRLIIRTETLWDYNNETTIVKGEQNKILAINTLTITLQTPLNCEYNTSVDSSYVETYTPKRAEIDGLEIDFGTLGTSGLGIGLSGLVDSSIRNLTAINCGLAGASLVDCYNVEICNPTVLDCYLSTLGYGIQVNSSSHVRIIGGLLRNNRHGVDFSGGFPCHECSVVGATIIGNTSEGSCLGSHGSGNRLSYIGNTLSNSVAGIQSRSPNTTVVGNFYHGVTSFVVAVGAPGLHIKNNTQVVNSAEAIVGANQLADAFFLEIGANGDPDLTIFDVNVPTTEMIVEGNVCQPLEDFIILQSDVSNVRRLTVVNNQINFQGASHKFINADAVSGSAQFDGATCFFAPNVIRVTSGSYTALSNVAVTNPADFVNDATPSVLSPGHGGIFYINNTNPTVITNFDDGLPGQEIVVYVQDNQTTIDFTGTALKGNNGADYAPAAPFVLRARFDGNNWICSV